jgi:hypothetical protein
MRVNEILMEIYALRDDRSQHTEKAAVGGFEF